MPLIVQALSALFEFRGGKWFSLGEDSMLWFEKLIQKNYSMKLAFSEHSLEWLIA